MAKEPDAEEIAKGKAGDAVPGQGEQGESTDLTKEAPLRPQPQRDDKPAGSVEDEGKGD